MTTNRTPALFTITVTEAGTVEVEHGDGFTDADSDALVATVQAVQVVQAALAR